MYIFSYGTSFWGLLKAQELHAQGVEVEYLVKENFTK